MTLLCLPAWMEILVNVIGYAGFVGLATGMAGNAHHHLEQRCAALRR
jgi:hypothetical protein